DDSRGDRRPRREASRRAGVPIRAQCRLARARRIPRPAGRDCARAGRRSSAHRSARAARRYPSTILELVGVPVPAGLNGESLVPLMTGRGIRQPVDVFAENGFHWTPVATPYLGYPPMTRVFQLRL